MHTIDALMQRYSGRQLQAPAPDADAVRLILQSAVRAPDHGALRPWRFCVIEGDGRRRLGELLLEHARRARGGTLSEEAAEKERLKALRAPLVIVVAAVVRPGKIPAIEQVLSAGAAAQNMLMAAFALGFNAVWKTGGAAYDDRVKAAFGLEPKDAIVGFLYIGSESRRPPPPRAAVADLTQWWSDERAF